MKMTLKRTLAMLLTVAMVCALFVPAVSADGYWWEQFVTEPLADQTAPGVDANGQVHPQGNYVLFTSDAHRYTYLARDLMAAANTMIAADGAEGNVGLFALGGDFANEYVLYDDNMSILKKAFETSPGTVATYTKGNHEGSVSDAEFIEKTGMSRIGETALAEGYHFYNFGALDKNQTFQKDDIAKLKAYLESLQDNKPVFVTSHYPLHYYNDRRTSKNAADVLNILNDYPQVIFLWGHNHTEADPAYGYVRTAGDIIQTGADVSTTKEINFTYANLGALRDGINGANGVLAAVNGTEVLFRYVNLHNSLDGNYWTDAQGNENPVRVAAEPNAEASKLSEVKVDTAADLNVITIANIKIDRPLVDKTPAESANEYSGRFSAGEVTWTTTEGGAPVEGVFQFDTNYTATVTLTAEEGKTFAPDAKVYVNKIYVGPNGTNPNAAAVTVSADGKEAVVVFNFDKTTAEGEVPVAPATGLTEGKQYVLVATDDNYAASYLYNPADHGEESRPEYTVASSDVVIREGKLVSEIENPMIFTAQQDYEGYLMYSDASLQYFAGETEEPLPTTANFLNMSARGGDLGLEAAEQPGTSVYCDWQIDDAGLPYIDMDGVDLYAAYEKGLFTFTEDAGSCNVRFFEVGTDASGLIYNVNATVAKPVAGEAAVAEAEISDTVEVKSVVWSAESFDYSTAYTVTITAEPKDGYTVTDYLTARVNGDNAEVSYADGQIVITYTFAQTGMEPGEVLNVDAVAVDAFTSGKQYIIVSNGTAIAGGYDGIYGAGVPVTAEGGKIVSPITSDMLVTMEGNSVDGFSMKTVSGYYAGRQVGDSPDTWGILCGDTPKVTVDYVDGKLQIVSTGNVGGPPTTTVSYVYENNGHFNYFSIQQDAFEIYEVSPKAIAFEDVAEGKYYSEPVLWAAESGIAKGMTETTFVPNGTATRAQVLTFLWRANGSPKVEAENPFVDVQEGRFYYDAVLWAVDAGITKGVDATHFEPDRIVNRAEVITFIYRAKGCPAAEGTTQFTDVKVPSYYADAVAWGVENEVVKGKTATTFAPKDSCTRGQSVTFLYRVYG